MDAATFHPPPTIHVSDCPQDGRMNVDPWDKGKIYFLIHSFIYFNTEMYLFLFLCIFIYFYQIILISKIILTVRLFLLNKDNLLKFE